MGKLIILGFAILIGLTFLPTVLADKGIINKMQEFLTKDTTNTHKYLPYYTCGHFSRDLATNASKENISIGGILLSNHPVFRGRWNSHAMNYFMIGKQIMLIEPQTDNIYPLEDSMYNYYRLYPDGTQLPSNWNRNLSHTGIIGG